MELDVHTSEARRGLINSVQSGCLTKPLSVRRFNLTSGRSAAGSRRTLYYTVYISIQIAGKKKSDTCPCASSTSWPPDESVLLFSEVHHGKT